eukprot:CAMPEP_0177781458 /NCGR_PEP_ID=MMETSP0491_2-20121128/17866_1 /TAXON_ID=63592 /ORGANISM="Tetraselmis chuii, Strain PLY429" /LENGTH=75 /DNA_ID=CAMNT_0019301535 /DNA_START=82 /DNA_END=305 /DNA_ORIENTATION=+
MARGRKRSAAASSEAAPSSAADVGGSPSQKKPPVTRLTAHSKFFDQLVDLIPARYYHNSIHDAPGAKFLPKEERA